MLAFLLITLITACKTYYPSQMLKTGPDYQYAQFPDTPVTEQYRIAPNDILQLQLYTHNGENIFEAGTEQNAVNSGNSEHNYFECQVEFDGNAKIPVLNRVNLSGLTLREAEKKLEDLYSDYFVSPFVLIKVVNNRVIIFPGGKGGSAKVVPLENSNTTLLEALALAGGITDGKASKIKLIRGDLKNPKVYLIDLSTIEGMKEADLVLQANDIIYVEPRVRLTAKISEDVLPYLTLISSLVLIYTLFTK